MNEIVLVGRIEEIDFKKESIGTIITDPPFGIGRQGTTIRRQGGKYGVAKDIDTRIAPWDLNPPKWEIYLNKFWKWLIPSGILILFHEKLSLLEIARWWEKQGGKVRHIAVWCIPNATPQARKVKWRNATNFILIATKNTDGSHAYHYDKGQGEDYFLHPMVPGIARCRNKLGETHPTEKPIGVGQWLLQWWGDRNLPLLDPFCGTGSFLVAAKLCGFKYIIGEDIDENWAYIAYKRLMTNDNLFI